LKEGREVEFGFLGIAPRNLSGEERQSLSGVRVDGVYSGTPAERAGLKQSDLITHINGQPILDIDGLILALSRLPADAVVHLTVQQNGKPTPIDVTLAKFTTAAKPLFTVPGPAWRGLRVDFPTAQPGFILKVEQNRVPPEPCVYVAEVEDNSAAASIGLKQGMFITHVGGTRVKNPKEFNAAVAGKSGPLEIRLLLEPTEVDPTSSRPVFEPQLKSIPETAN
jgi:serine protease Do